MVVFINVCSVINKKKKWNCIYLVVCLVSFSQKEKIIISKHFGFLFFNMISFVHFTNSVFFFSLVVSGYDAILIPVSRSELAEPPFVKSSRIYQARHDPKTVWLTNCLTHLHNISVTLWRLCRNSVTTISRQDGDFMNKWINT